MGHSYWFVYRMAQMRLDNYIIAPINQICIIYSSLYHSDDIILILELIFFLE